MSDAASVPPPPPAGANPALDVAMMTASQARASEPAPAASAAAADDATATDAVHIDTNKCEKRSREKRDSDLMSRLVETANAVTMAEMALLCGLPSEDSRLIEAVNEAVRARMAYIVEHLDELRIAMESEQGERLRHARTAR